MNKVTNKFNAICGGKNCCFCPLQFNNVVEIFGNDVKGMGCDNAGLEKYYDKVIKFILNEKSTRTMQLSGINVKKEHTLMMNNLKRYHVNFTTVCKFK